MTRKERFMVYAIFFMLIFFVSFYWVSPRVTKQLDLLKHEKQTLENKQKIVEIKTQESTLEKRSLALGADILKMKKELKDRDDVQKYISLSKEGVFVKDTKKQWIVYFDNLISMAKKNHLHLSKIEKKVQAKKTVFEVVVQGGYVQLVAFLYDIENKEHFLLVKKLTLTTEYMELEISILGA